jgi:hypothetical protein
MPIPPETLSSLAADYARGMTSIRGRRVQRLVKREFAGADHVLRVQVGGSIAALLGVSTSGAAYCATDGRGAQACVVRWLHDATCAQEARFDLLKDSLPLLGTRPLPLAGLSEQARREVRVVDVPSDARPLVALATATLASSAL